MILTLWNTRTRSKERFRPLDCNRVTMYLCGPTVYDRAHIGNARPAVVFDQLYRLLRRIYGERCVTYVRNITDVDDKINKKASDCSSEGDERSPMEIIREITDRTIGWYHADLEHLRVLPPDFEPRATDFIPEMVRMIQLLIDKGHAYFFSDHVLFDVQSYREYGNLARRTLEEMQAGARVEVSPYKRNDLDFVLWKPSAPDLPGWESPWGRGRPGWHIECSAMSSELLGESFDIHGGGIDLVFPHHENELAQSMCAHPGSTFANYWMHNGLVRVESRKMAKSLGNFLTVRDLIDRGVPGSAIRYVLLSGHYRKPLDWTESKLAEAGEVLGKWHRAIPESQASGAGFETGPELDKDFLAALCDDLNTPKAFARMHELHASGDAEGLRGAVEFLGIAREFRSEDKDSELIGDLLQARQAAREAKDYEIADCIRKLLVEAGVSVMDGKGRGYALPSEPDRGKLENIRAQLIEDFGYIPTDKSSGSAAPTPPRSKSESARDAVAADRREKLARWHALRRDGLSAADAADAVAVPRATLFRWDQRNREGRLKPDKAGPRTPLNAAWPPELVNAVLAVRNAFPMRGKVKIAEALRHDGWTVSNSMVGRILRSLMDSGKVRRVAVWRQQAAKTEHPGQRDQSSPMRSGRSDSASPQRASGKRSE